jgi:polar amino acid transport system substrate-binding protein
MPLTWEEFMTRFWTKRDALATIGAAAFITPAAADQGLLPKLKQQGSIKIGIADDLPWSKLNPDGTVSGVGPSIIKAVVPKLGIPKVEAVVGTYGQLVPGLLVGRWDMIGASLTISPERCQQVLFTDPFYRLGEFPRYFAYLPGSDIQKDPPKTYKDAAGRFSQIGITTGDAFIPVMQKAIADTGNKATIVQFNDPQLLIEGLLTKRVPIVIADLQTLQVLEKQRGGFVYTTADSGRPNAGSGGAFRKQDRDVRDAFNVEFRALKASGEVAKILKEYGFEYDAKYMDISGDQACAL